jgi:hypothetical protein
VSIYVLVLLIMLFVADILYVAYSFSKKKFQALWPLELLAVVAPRMVTFLFLPITETLIEMVSCELVPGGQAYVMQSYPEVPCWQGWHILHATVAILSAFMFVVVCSVVALTLYEPRIRKDIINCRQNSNGEVIYILNKIIIEVFFSFNVIKNDWFYVLLLLSLSGALLRLQLAQPLLQQVGERVLQDRHLLLLLHQPDAVRELGAARHGVHRGTRGLGGRATLYLPVLFLREEE